MAFKIKGFGWKKDFNDPRDYTVAIVAIDAANLPARMDNRRWCTPIKDQGNMGSCTANAGVSIYEYMERKALGHTKAYSRLFLYKATRMLMGEEGIGDSGAYIRTTLRAIRRFGIPKEDLWPYSDDPTRFDLMPPPSLWALGQRFQSLEYFRLDHSDRNKNLQRMKENILKGYALICGFFVFDGCMNEARTNGGIFPYPSNNEEKIGGQSVLIVGYDDDKVATNPRDDNAKTGCFLIRNSWGESWGDNGYGWLPYRYFLSAGNNDLLADDVWIVTQTEWTDTGEFSY